MILSEQIGAICELLKYTDKRFARDYYLNNLDDSIKRYKDGENCFIGKEALSLIDSLLRNPHLEYDEAVHLMRLASDMRFIRKNSMVSDSPIPIFTSNMDNKTLIDGMMQVHYEELRTLLLNEIEKNILS